MKKILLVIMLLFLIGCSNKKGYTEINYDKLATKIENKESFVLVLGKESCSACGQYRVTMEKIIKDKKIEIFYIDVSKETEENYSKIYSKYALNLTPTTIFVVNGEEKSTYDRLLGATEYNEVIKQLEKYGYEV